MKNCGQEIFLHQASSVRWFVKARKQERRLAATNRRSWSTAAMAEARFRGFGS